MLTEDRVREIAAEPESLKNAPSYGTYYGQNLTSLAKERRELAQQVLDQKAEIERLRKALEYAAEIAYTEFGAADKIRALTSTQGGRNDG